ncbi:MAG: hypothetical protein U0575_03305 [Phycisphaerales bacterium]
MRSESALTTCIVAGATMLLAIPAPAGVLASVQVNVDAAGADIAGDAANEPSIGVDPTAPNRIAIGWRQFDSIGSSFRTAGYAWSDDGGRSWTFPGALEPGVFRSDPVLAVSPEGQFLYYSLKNNFTCDLFRSNDGGQTWPLKTVAFGGDKAWMTVDLTDGVGHGNIYATWSTAAGPYTSATFIRSVDGGATFQSPVAYPMPPRFGTMAVGRDGEVLVSGVQSAPFDSTVFLCVRSVTAQDPMLPVAFDQTSVVDLGGRLSGSTGPNPAGLLGQVNVDVNRSNSPYGGEIYMLCSVDPPATPDGNDPLDVMFARSIDGGATWSAPVRVNDDVQLPGAPRPYQWFGTMSTAPNGRIDVVWNDTRNAANQATPQTSELYYSHSEDGGRTWAPNQAISPPFNHFLGYPQQNKLGDYYHMVSDDVGAHLAWAATFTGGQDVYYLRIGDYDCNGNGVGDTIDIANGAGDCNGNGIPDTCEIAAGVLADSDGDGIPDICDNPADLNNDGVVDGADLGLLLAAWGTTGPGDLNGDGVVDGADLGELLAWWM